VDLRSPKAFGIESDSTEPAASIDPVNGREVTSPVA
jgi:hypothetical protein